MIEKLRLLFKRWSGMTMSDEFYEAIDALYSERIAELEKENEQLVVLSENLVKQKDKRIAALEAERDAWQSRWMAAEKTAGENLGGKIAERELHALEVDELTQRIAMLDEHIAKLNGMLERLGVDMVTMELSDEA